MQFGDCNNIKVREDVLKRSRSEADPQVNNVL